MLSFLREQGFEDSFVEGTGKSANGETKKHQPTDASACSSEKTQEQRYLTVAGQGKNVRRMTMFLVVLFVIGLLCLLFMIKKSVPQAATASSVGIEQSQIEKAISRLTGVGSEMFKRMDQIVKKFYEFSDVEQVQVNELAKNPFALQILLANAEGSSDSKEGAINAELIRQQQIRQGTKDLQLLTVCQTDEGYCCMIDDKILYEGDSIKGYKISQISDSFVKLELEGVEVVLKLSK
jgi:preprotein translocase subunit SecG